MNKNCYEIEITHIEQDRYNDCACRTIYICQSVFDVYIDNVT